MIRRVINLICWPDVAFACGSASINTFFQNTKAAAKLNAVVDFTNATFWLAIPIIFSHKKLISFKNTIKYD